MSRQGKFSPETEAKASLLSVLFKKKMLNANAAIINELPLYKFSRRVDIALIDKKIIFFEIKSKSDKLTRLEGQAKAFSYYCDKLIILCAKKHVQNVLKTAPKCSGIWQLNDDLSISVVRVGKESKLADKEKLIDLVNLDELRSILRTNGIKASGKRRKHAVLLAKEIPLTRLRKYILDILRQRHSKFSQKLISAFSKNKKIKASDVLALRRRELGRVRSNTKRVDGPTVDDVYLSQLATQSGGELFGKFPHSGTKRKTKV